MKRRFSMQALAAVAAAAALATLGGCAGIRTLSTEVSSFGEWPVGRTAGSYAFERLPSQQARAAETNQIEAAAVPALAAAGFTPVATGQQPDVLVQVGAHDGRAAYQPWGDPLWWRGGPGFWAYGPWGGPRWGMGARFDFPRIERQVAVLIRDRATGKPLYESRAASQGNSGSDGALLGAMFKAALTDFPRLGVNPRRVDVVVGS
jgi:hypothetical protein